MPEPIFELPDIEKKIDFDKAIRTSYSFLADTIWRLLGTGSTVSDEEIIKRLREKEWGDDPKSNNDYQNKPKPDIEFNDEPEPNPVYQPPRRIYDPNDDRFINNPRKPTSNLVIEETEEVLGQSDTKVVIGESITLAQAIENQEFGRLLYNPVTDKPTKVRQVVDITLGQKIKELNDVGLEQFTKYLDDDSNQSLFDACVLALPQSLRGLAGDLGLVFGAEVVRILAYYFTSASMNTFIGISDNVPLNYEVVFEAPVYSPNKFVLDKIKMAKQRDINKLILGDTEGKLVRWESYLLQAVRDTYDKTKLEETPIEARNLPELLRNLLAQSFRRLGLDDYPIAVPKNLTQEPEPGELESIESNQSLVDFLLWQVKAFDGVLGQFPINIEIEDNDLIQTGNQPLDIKLPNLAETLAELTGKVLLNEALVNALLTISLKNIAETGMSKQTAIQNYYLLTAIQEYLGFKTTQKSKEVEFTFNPGVILEKEDDQTLSKAIENSQIKIPIEVNDDEDSLEEQLKSLVEAARIIKAVHWRNLDLKGNVPEQLKSIIKNADKLMSDLDANGKDTLEDFLNSLQLGFANKSSSIDSTKPFGRDYNRRPRVKDLD